MAEETPGTIQAAATVVDVVVLTSTPSDNATEAPPRLTSFYVLFYDPLLPGGSERATRDLH